MTAKKLRKLLKGHIPSLLKENKGFPFDFATEPREDGKGPRVVFDIGPSQEDARRESFDVKIEHYKIVKLIEFALRRKTFTVDVALAISTLDHSELEKARRILFELPPGTENPVELSQSYEWVLKPEAFLRYMAFTEYRESLRSARRDLHPALYFILSIGGLALLCLLAAAL